jgi:hypothetical protein
VCGFSERVDSVDDRGVSRWGVWSSGEGRRCSAAMSFSGAPAAGRSVLGLPDGWPYAASDGGGTDSTALFSAANDRSSWRAEVGDA